VNVHIGRRGTLAAVGLLGAATLWAVNTQLGEVLPYPDCRHHTHFSGLSSLAAAIALVLAGWCSWRAYHTPERSPEHAASHARRALRLLAGVGAGAALLFLFALVLQAAAGFILTGCER
jgi:hypothetical protein